MDAAKSVTATFDLVPYDLAVEKFAGGAGTGLVTSVPAGVSCSGTCTVAFNSGTVVTLSATADTGSLFGGWTGACSGTGGCVVTMDAAKTVGYSFHPESFTLTVSKAGSGGGMVSDSALINCGSTCSAPYLYNASITLTATPATNSTFAGWGGACAGSGTCNVTMQGARTVTATFNAVAAPTADLAVTQTASPDPAFTGSDVTFTVTVANSGPSTATAVTLTDTLSGGVTFMSASAGCVHVAGTVTCNMDSIASGASKQVQVVVRPLSAGSITNFASVSTSASDPFFSNNTHGIGVLVGTPSGTLSNISTRMQVLGGNDVMIGGFVIGGSTSKTVVIRARGPSLVPFGITNALANPTLQLVRSSDQATLATNDDWGSATNAPALTASGFAPSNDLEAAILISLPPGAYTAIVSGVGGGTGVGIVEVFEVDHPETPLANISTRGRVLTGNDVMIGGFVIQGSAPQTVVIRARGPSLVPFGIANALANPTLQVVRSSDQAVMATNDDWQVGTNVAALSSSGFAPSNTLESAVLITLDPGAYTVIVSGIGGGTGVGIVEVFAQ
jgi:uncharacterized repeat protein (TIGR01451 family)